MSKLLLQKGFTLIEMLITMAIVGVVSMIAANSYNNYIDTTKNSLAISQITSLSLVIDSYYLDNGYYPSNLEQIGNNNLLDPWGNPYVFINFREYAAGTGTHMHHQNMSISIARKDRNLVPINSNYDLYSPGKDGKSKPPLVAKDSHDDIIYANDGDYIGIAHSY